MMPDKPLYKKEWVQLGVLLLMIAFANVMIQIENGVAWSAVNWNAVLAAAFFAGARVLGKSRQDAAKILQQQIQTTTSPFAQAVGVVPPQPVTAPPQGAVPQPSVLQPTTHIPLTEEQRDAELARIQAKSVENDAKIREKLEGDRKIVGRDGA